MSKETMLHKAYTVEVKKAEDSEYSLEAIFSTADEDRHGDVVQQNWDLKSYKANPVILNSHNYSDATEVVGKVTGIKVKEGKLQGKIDFAVNENPKAKIIFDLYSGGFLKAFSVGFIPKDFDNKGQITKSELLEISTVSVPANAYALAKAKGIEVEQYETQEPEPIIDEVQEPNEDTSEEIIEPVGETDEANDTAGVEADTSSEDTDNGEIADEDSGEEGDDEIIGKPDEEKPEPVMENEEEITKSILLKINNAIKALHENRKVATRTQSDNSEVKRLVNSAVRNLLKVK